MKKSLLILFLIILSASLWSQSGPGSFLPDKDEVPGWRPEGDVTVFRSESLRKIAGEETPLIIEYGFNYAAARRYYNFNSRQIRIEVYTMESTFGSSGLFLRHSGREKVFSAYGNQCYEKPGEFGFWKQLYFIRMFSDKSDSTVSGGYRQMASFIDSKIKSRGIFPSILSLSDSNSKNVRIFRGPLALAEIYYFSPLNIFFVNEGIAFDSGDTTKIFLRYADNNEAVRRYTDAAGILGEMPRFSDFTLKDNFSFTMKDRDGKTLLFSVGDRNLEIRIKK